jgi:hypothetical protein
MGPNALFSDDFILLLQLIACSFMTGIILLIHLIHYPAFTRIKDSEFKSFSKAHSQRITWIVFPAMLIELGSSILLYRHQPSLLNTSLLISNLLIWSITALKSAPAHTKLSNGFNLETYSDLMIWNRARVLLWCSRLLILIFHYCL